MQALFAGPYNQLQEALSDTSAAVPRYTFSGQIMTVARFPYAHSIPLRRVIRALHSPSITPRFSLFQPRFPNDLTIIFFLCSAGTVLWRGESVGLCEVGGISSC